IACLVAIKKLLSLDRSSLSMRINWLWIRSGVKIALPLLAASLAFRGIFTLDRYLVENVAGLSALGPYTLFVGMVTAILSFLDAGVVVFSYPKLVASAKQQDGTAFRSGMKQLSLNVVAVTAVLAIACVLLAPYVVDWLDDP